MKPKSMTFCLTFWLLPVCLVALPGRTAKADETGGVNDIATVTSLIDSSTVAVVRIESEKLEPSLRSAVMYAASTLPTDARVLFRRSLKHPQVDAVWLMLSTAEPIEQMPLLVLQTSSSWTDRDGETLTRGINWQVRDIAGCRVVCPPRVARRLGDLRDDGHQEVYQAAWKILQDGPSRGAPVTFAIAPSEDQRRVLSQLSPQLPKPFNAMPTGLISGIVWAAGSIDAADPQRVQLHVRTHDEGDTTDLKSWIESPPPALPVGLRVVETSDPLHTAIRFGTKEEFGNELIERWIQTARDRTIRDNLMRVGLAMHNHHSAYNRLPPTGLYGDSKLSWRVHLLPFLGGPEQRLHAQFKLDEPWDSEHNLALVDRMPAVYWTDPTTEPGGRSDIDVIVGEAMMFHAAESRFRDVRDGLSNTIMAVHLLGGEQPWTQPSGFRPTIERLKQRMDPKSPLSWLNGDGSYHRELITDPETFLGRFTRAGGEVAR